MMAEQTAARRSAPRVEIERRIEWSDTDASGHHHHAAILRMAEEAEAELMERLGLAGLYGRLPRVHVEADFRRPLAFRDRVRVRLAVGELGRTSVTWEFEVRHGRRVAATGRVVAVKLAAGGRGPAPWTARERALLLGA